MSPDGVNIGPHITPEIERFGSLANQHSPSLIGLRGAVFLCPADKRRIGHGIGQVVANGIRIEDGCRKWRNFAAETGRCGIDDQVKMLLAQLVKAAGGNTAQLGERRCDSPGFLYGTVRNQQVGGNILEQCRHNTPGGAAGAQNQYPGVFDGKTKVVGKIADQANSIGIVALHFAVFPHDDGVDGPSQPGSSRENINVLRYLAFMRNRDIEAPDAFTGKPLEGAFEVFRGDIEGLIADVLPGLPGKHLVDNGRLAVRNRVADYAIPVRHAVSSPLARGEGHIVGRRRLRGELPDCDAFYHNPPVASNPAAVAAVLRGTMSIARVRCFFGDIRFAGYGGARFRVTLRGNGLSREKKFLAAPTTSIRCPWSENVSERYLEYHDREWGVPVHDDRRQFEFLTLEGAQAGLSWSTVLNKREGYRKAFADFDPVRVSRFSERKIEALIANPAIIRNRLKINSTVTNARAFLEIQEKFGSFDAYIWGFVDGEPVQNTWKKQADVPATSRISDVLSKDMKKRGFRLVGSTIIYAHMQATGMVNDHIMACFRYREVQQGS